MKKIITPEFTPEAIAKIRGRGGRIVDPNNQKVVLHPTATCCGSFEIHFKNNPGMGIDVGTEGILDVISRVPQGRLVICYLPIDGYQAHRQEHLDFYLAMREFLSGLGFMAKGKWKSSNTGHTVVLMMCFKQFQ